MPQSFILTAVLLFLSASYALLPRIVGLLGRAVGWHLRKRTKDRRGRLIARTEFEKKQGESSALSASTTLEDEWEKVDRNGSHSGNGDSPQDSSGGLENKLSGDQGLRDDEQKVKAFDGIVGFFHPFCNAGGGGERVLWAAMRATQAQWPEAICIVYTGDHDVAKEAMLKRVKDRFNIALNASHIHFLYPTTRSYVLHTTWPHFTLLGQSLGSLILGYDALSLLVPDIFIDTMGYSFVLALAKWLFPSVPVAAYVHYPTISTDMLGSLDSNVGEGKGGTHRGKGEGWRGRAKKTYWRLFAKLYSWTGGFADVVMTNSSWTQNHIQQLWGPARRKYNAQAYEISTVFPPCAVKELELAVGVDEQSEAQRKPNCLYIAQFRAEKNHALVLRSFAQLLKRLKTPAPTSSPSSPSQSKNSESTYDEDAHPHLTLIGSVRDSTDETHIYNLRLLAHELHITHAVTFLLNASWATILKQLQTASLGVNAMWNEHFGIGVVEYQAAGLLSVVNDSGGPKLDICIEMADGEGGTGPTGFVASTEEEYASGMTKALNLSANEKLQMRRRARRSARRFSEDAFDQEWRKHMSRLVHLRVRSEDCAAEDGI